MSGETLFVQGNEACARGALYAGLKFFAGYPITPSTEIAETLAELLPVCPPRSPRVTSCRPAGDATAIIPSLP